MSIMINNSDGSQSEVFTKEEHDKAVKDATETATKTATTTANEAAKTTFETQLEEYKKKNPSGADEIVTLKKSIEEKDTKITELTEDKGGEGGAGGTTDKDRDEQINRLRGEREEAEKELKEGLKVMGEQIKAITGDAKGELILAAVKALTEAQLKDAGGEAEAIKKIEVEFDGFAGDVVTRSDITARVTKATTLAIGVAPTPNDMDNAAGAGGKGSEDHGGDQPKPVSEVTKKVGTQLGISDKDREKFGPGGDSYKAPSTND